MITGMPPASTEAKLAWIAETHRASVQAREKIKLKKV